MRALLLMLLSALLVVSSLSLTRCVAAPSEKFYVDGGEVFDSWNICRTNYFHPRGALCIRGEPPNSVLPLIIEESLGEYTDVAYEVGRAMATRYPDVNQRAEAIFRYVQQCVEYHWEGVDGTPVPIAGRRWTEFARNADEMVLEAYSRGVAWGDCEDHAILMAVLCKAAGIKSAIVVWMTPEGGHCTNLLYLPGYPTNLPVRLGEEEGWVWAEATGDENPLGWTDASLMRTILERRNFDPRYWIVAYVVEPDEVPSGTMEPGAGVSKELCFIATALRDSDLDSRIALLRSFRSKLASSCHTGSEVTSLLNAWYYSWSPSMAKLIINDEPLRALSRLALYPLLISVAVADEAYRLIGSGGEVSFLCSLLLMGILLGVFYLTPLVIAAAYVLAPLGTRHIDLKPQWLKWSTMLTVLFLAAFTVGQLLELNSLLVAASLMSLISAALTASLGLTMAVFRLM
ncbi:MAG: hypothetical protein DRJ98_08645, partial [Thermoprotei archaeon]